MKISGFTIVRNGNYYAYPYKEAILSVLPLCDEFVVNVGISDDGTLEDIKALGSVKIKIIEREWDMSIRESGRVLSIETNIAKRAVRGGLVFFISRVMRCCTRSISLLLKRQWINILIMMRWKDSVLSTAHFYGFL